MNAHIQSKTSAVTRVGAARIGIGGPVGSGKSHLANIWKNISEARDIHPTAGGDAARTAETGPVLFEDADRRGFDDTELFHVINSVRQKGKIGRAHV